MGSLSLTMFLVLTTTTLCLLVSLSSPLPHQRTEYEERGLILDILGLGGDTTTTTAPVDTTTFPTLYGDLVNLFNLIFNPETTTTTTIAPSVTATTPTTTTTTTTTPTTTTTTTTTTT